MQLLTLTFVCFSSLGRFSSYWCSLPIWTNHMWLEWTYWISYHCLHRRCVMWSWSAADIIRDWLLQALCDIQHTMGDWVESLLLFDANGCRRIFLSETVIGQWHYYGWYVFQNIFSVVFLHCFFTYPLGERRLLPSLLVRRSVAVEASRRCLLNGANKLTWILFCS